MRAAALPVRMAPPGKLHHLLADHLPAGWVVQPFGPDGAKGTRANSASVIVTRADLEGNGVDWTHASIAGAERLPSYGDLVELHRWVFGDGWAYQVFAPPADHVNIHPHALHLWGRSDGARALPNFGGITGSI